MNKEGQLSRTALIWLQYMTMLDILHMSLKAELTGNCALHFQAVHDMLPYFAASGPTHYMLNWLTVFANAARVNSTDPP